MNTKTRSLKLLVFMTSSLFAFSSFALMEYGDVNGGNGRNFKTPNEIVKRRGPGPKRAAKPSMGNKFINMAVKYESIKVDSTVKEGKSQKMTFEGHIQTQNDLFLDFSYWQGQSDSKGLVEDKSYQKGNPKLLLGLNWLKLGRGGDAANIDIMAGGSYGQKGSEFASSRNDKIVAVQTSKPFEDLMVGFGFQLTMTGSPKEEDELHIGNLSKFYGAIAWQATNDIRFGIELSATKIAASKNDEVDNRLRDSISFSSLNPKLQLLLSPVYNLELGGVFRTRKANSFQDLVAAQIYEEDGAYGNSIYSALNLEL